MCHRLTATSPLVPSPASGKWGGHLTAEGCSVETLAALAAAVGGRRPRFSVLVLLPPVLLPKAMRLPGGQVCGPAWVVMERPMEGLRQRRLRLSQ